MCHYIMYLAVVVLSIGVVASSDECGENSHYDKCPPNHCKPGMACTQVCQPACVCDKGYFDKDGKCVKKDEPQCPANETMASCANGCIFEDCPKADPGPPGSSIQCSPPDECVSGCICSNGYNRLDGKCVLKEDCPY